VNTEVVVVDNSSVDATAKVARSFGARVITESEHNIARVRNCGAAAAIGEVLVFLDADTHIPEELLPRIHQICAAPGCVGGAVDTEYRPNKRSIRVYLGLWRILGRAVGIAQGATQFCLRDTFTSLGGYDESLFMGEDVDFYYRLRGYARRVGGHVHFIDELKVVPSCRRFDRWPLWRTLLWTNPLVITHCAGCAACGEAGTTPPCANLTGRASARQRAAFRQVLQIPQETAGLLRPGLPAASPYNACSRASLN
jgi:glycosyltransferase involved in cell wall biosynthesis